MLVEDSSTLKNKQREQIIHTETLNMMAKYQLIFLKMETHMRKVALTIKLKTNQQRLYAYRKIKQASIVSNRQYEIVYLNMNQKLQQMETLFQRRRKQNIIFAFQKIRFQFPKNKNEDIKKSFLKVIASKDSEIKNLHKKEQEILENINIQRSREQELQIKLKQKDIQLQQLELDARKNTCNRTIDSKVIFQLTKLRNLELENQEMQEKVVGTEDSVNLFIREMNDLLDSHEISTNLDSDENGSYEQPNIEYQSQRLNQIQRHPKPKNFYSNQLTRKYHIKVNINYFELPMENSKSELLNWINQLVKMNHSKIEQLGNGIAYCKLLHIFDPHSLPPQKINQKVKVQLDNISNLKLLQQAMSKLHFKKSLDIDKLSKLVFHENYELLLFLKQQYTLKFQTVDQENQKDNLQIQIQFKSKNIQEENLLTQFKEEIKSILTNSELSPKEIINQLKSKLDIQCENEEQQVDDQKQLFRTDSKRKIELQEIHQKNVMLCETPNSGEGNLSYQKNNEILEFNVNPINYSKTNSIFKDSLIKLESSSKKILEISNQSQLQEQQQQQQQQKQQSSGTPQFSQVKQPIFNQSTENITLSGKQSPKLFDSYHEAQQIQLTSQNKELETFYSAQKQICYNSGIKQYANSVQRLPQSQQRYGFNNMEQFYNEKLKSEGYQQAIQEEIYPQQQQYTPICSNGGGLQEE